MNKSEEPGCCQLNEYYNQHNDFHSSFNKLLVNGSHAENENRESQGHCNFYVESLRVYRTSTKSWTKVTESKDSVWKYLFENIQSGLYNIRKRLKTYKWNRYDQKCTIVDGSDVDEFFRWSGHGSEWRSVTGTWLATSFASAVAHRSYNFSFSRHFSFCLLKSDTVVIIFIW